MHTGLQYFDLRVLVWVVFHPRLQLSVSPGLHDKKCVMCYSKYGYYLLLFSEVANFFLLIAVYSQLWALDGRTCVWGTSQFWVHNTFYQFCLVFSTSDYTLVTYCHSTYLVNSDSKRLALKDNWIIWQHIKHNHPSINSYPQQLLVSFNKVRLK